MVCHPQPLILSLHPLRFPGSPIKLGYQIVTFQATGVFAMEKLREAFHVGLWGLEEGEEEEEEEEE